MKRRENEDARRETKDVAGLMSQDSCPHQPWPRVRLGDVCEVRAGGDYKLFACEAGEYPVYGTGGEMGRVSKWRCPADSIIVGRKGTLDNPMFIREPFWNIDTCFGLIPGERVLPEFLFRFCQGFDFYSLVPASGRPSTTSSAIKGITVPLPPLAEQKAIVARLTRELAAVDRLAKNFEGLESAAEAEFKAELKETFDALESEAAKVKLGGVCERLSSGKNITAKKISKAGTYPVYGANGIRGFTEVMNFEGECCIIGRQGALCGNVRYFSGQAYMSDHAVVATYKPKCLAKFMLHQLRHMDLGRLSTQAAQPGLSVKALSQEYVVLPPLPVQREIVSRLTSSSARRDKLIALARQGRNAAAQLRKAILKEAFA